MNLIIRPTFGMMVAAILLWVAILDNLGVDADTFPLTCDVVLEVSVSQQETNTVVLDTELVQDKVRHVLVDRLDLEANIIESISVSYQLEEGRDSEPPVSSNSNNNNNNNNEQEKDLHAPSAHRRRLRKNRKPKKKKPNKPKKKKAPVTNPDRPCFGAKCQPPFTFHPKPAYLDWMDDDDDQISWNFIRPTHWRSARDHDERKLQLQTIKHHHQEMNHQELENNVCNELRTLQDGHSGLQFESCSISLNCRDMGLAESRVALS